MFGFIIIIMAVYPRARGEAVSGPVSILWDRGLSPRSRGSRMAFSRSISPSGSIPALAGKPKRVL